MGQFESHVFVCTSGDVCPTQGDVEGYVKALRAGALNAGKKADVRVNKSGCFNQCGHGPMIVVYPENVWYAGVRESDLQEILTSHIVGGKPVERLRYDPGKPGANKIDVEAKAAPAAPEPATASQGPAWKRVCRPEDVPANGMKQFSVDGTDVLIVNAGPDFVAYQAMCPHEAIPLEQGVHDGSTMTCLEHMWQFDLRTGAPMGDAETGLKGYPLKQEQGEIYVALSGKP
jgi:nitrite reductase/ring-hydroxylating ferredoxin subunit/(2Fe-2S) ferredoxin